MIIAGIQKTTLIDYPGKIAATVFLSGCNFRCPWCYSSELVLPEKIKKQPSISKKEFFSFLNKRKGLLDAIVICGGEPTINNDLPDFIKEIKKLGYLVKLDTNGSNPKMLRQLISERLIDYVAMDIKLPKKRYSELFLSIDDIQKSIDMLKKDNIDYEFRSTVLPDVHTKKDILSMAKWISGAKKYYLQNFKSEKTIDPKFEQAKSYSEEDLNSIKQEIIPFFETCDIR